MTGRKVVLVVEDEPLLLSTVVEELLDMNFEVIEAMDGPRALDLIESAPAIDLLFTDIRLPGRVDGWQIADAARQRWPSIPVLYTTGFAPDPGREIQPGEMLRKPYTSYELASVFTRLGVLPN